MRTIAHIINPVDLPPPSDLHVAQPITLDSMLAAANYVEGRISIDLLSAQYPEDRQVVPAGFRATPDLDRSILDLGVFEKQLKLPLLGDILGRLYEHSGAEWLIYTNVDIGLQPNFYEVVSSIIDLGYDAFVINRRTVSNRFTSPHELPLIYEQNGDRHGGYDCFVFNRALFPRIDVDHIALGMPKLGQSLLVNLAASATRFAIYRDLCLTFHIGNARRNRDPALADMRAHNRAAYLRIWSGLNGDYTGISAWRPQELDRLRLSFKRLEKTASKHVGGVLPIPVFNSLRSIYRAVRGERTTLREFDTQLESINVRSLLD